MNSSAVLQSLRNKLLTVGLTGVSIGDLPALDAEGIALKPSDGNYNTRYFGSSNILTPLVTVNFRYKDYATGQTAYDAVTQALDKYADSTNGILSCMLAGTPSYLGRSGLLLHEWMLIFKLEVM